MVNKDQVKGAAKQATGAGKEAVGKATGSTKTEMKGKARRPPARPRKKSATRANA